MMVIPQPHPRQSTISPKQVRSEHLNFDYPPRGFVCDEWVPQWPTEWWRRNLENVAGSSTNSGRGTEHRRTEKVTMHITGSTECSVFEVMVLDVGNAVRHIRLPCLESAGPHPRIASYQTNQPMNSVRQLTNQQFRSNRAVSKFRVS